MNDNFKIWKKGLDKNKDQLYLRLFQTEDGDINLCAVDSEGERIEAGLILTIDTDLGIIVLHDCMSDDIPLKTDFCETPLAYAVRDIKSQLKRMDDMVCPAHKIVIGKDEMPDFLKEILKKVSGV